MIGPVSPAKGEVTMNPTKRTPSCGTWLLALLAAGSAVLGTPGQAHAQTGDPVQLAISGLTATAIGRHTVQLRWLVSYYASVETVTIRRAALDGSGKEIAAVPMLISSDQFPFNKERVMTFSDSGLKPSTTYRYTVQLFPISGQRFPLDWGPQQHTVKTVELESVEVLKGVLNEVPGKALDWFRRAIAHGVYPEAIQALGEWYKLYGSELWAEVRKAMPQSAAEIEKAFADAERAFRDRFGVGAPGPVSGKLVGYADSYRFPPGEGTSVKVNSNDSGRISFYNKGDGPVTITRIEYPNPPFFPTARPDLLNVQVPPGKWVELVITFRPSAAGEFRDKLTIQTNNGSVTANLVGIARQ
jgi:hypothetical protein